MFVWWYWRRSLHHCRLFLKRFWMNCFVGSSSSGCTSATIKSMSIKHTVPQSLISSPRHWFMCLSWLNFIWPFDSMGRFCSACASFYFLLSHYNSISVSWCYAWYLHTSCLFLFELAANVFLLLLQLIFMITVIECTSVIETIGGWNYEKIFGNGIIALKV